MQRLGEWCGAAPEKEKENSKTRKKEVFALVASVCSRRNFSAYSRISQLSNKKKLPKLLSTATINCQKPKAYTRRDKQLLCEAFYLAESVLEEWCGAAPRRVVRCSAWLADAEEGKQLAKSRFLR